MLIRYEICFYMVIVCMHVVEWLLCVFHFSFVNMSIWSNIRHAVHCMSENHNVVLNEVALFSALFLPPPPLLFVYFDTHNQTPNLYMSNNFGN